MALIISDTMYNMYRGFITLDLFFPPRVWPWDPCRGWDLGLKAGIWASRLGFGPRGWDLSLETEIGASRLGIELRGWDLDLKGGGRTEKKEEEEEEKEKILHM